MRRLNYAALGGAVLALGLFIVVTTLVLPGELRFRAFVLGGGLTIIGIALILLDEP